MRRKWQYAGLLIAAALAWGAGGDAPRYWIESVAGSNEVGDGGPALEAQLGAVEGIALDAAGNVYLADSTDNRIRKVELSTGMITTVAGDGHAGDSGDGGPAVQALLNHPYGVAVDGAGNLYVADFGNGRIRRISPGGEIETVAGGGAPGAPKPALAARLKGPRNVAVDAAGNLYLSDFADHRVYRVTPYGHISTVAGTGIPGRGGEGPAIAAALNHPAGLAVETGGGLIIADSGNNRVCRVAGGKITTVLGGVVAGLALSRPTGVAVDGSGNLYVADSGNHRVLRRRRDGRVEVLAGADELGEVRDVAVGRYGSVYAGGGGRVFRIEGSGSVTPLAGNGAYGVYEDGVQAAHAYLDGPIGVAAGPDGSLYIAEEGRYRVRRVGEDGLIRTVAGTGERGFSGDGGPATAARLVDPVAVAVGPSGAFWVADYLGNRIRRVDPDGIITTAAGNGEAGYDGEANLAEQSVLNRPRGVVVDSRGNVFIADSGNHRVRRIDPNGIITTVAGNGVPGYSGWLWTPTATFTSPMPETTWCARSFRAGSSSPSPATEAAATPATAGRRPRRNWIPRQPWPLTPKATCSLLTRTTIGFVKSRRTA